jgi:predicted nucleic acid-binding protein
LQEGSAIANNACVRRKSIVEAVTRRAAARGNGDRDPERGEDDRAHDRDRSNGDDGFASHGLSESGTSIGRLVLSVIRRQLSSGTLNAQQANDAVYDLLALPITLYPTTPRLRRCWELRSNVSAYDACYVALAEALDGALLTADARLANAPGTRCAFLLV